MCLLGVCVCLLGMCVCVCVSAGGGGVCVCAYSFSCVQLRRMCVFAHMRAYSLSWDPGL